MGRNPDYYPYVMREDVHNILESVNHLVVIAEADARHDLLALVDWNELRYLVAKEVASDIIPVGSVLHEKWVDTRTTVSTEYDYGLRAMHYQDVDTEDKAGIPGMMLQSRLALPFATQFDAMEAFYAVPADGLAAGTYHVHFEAAVGKVEAGELDFQFTLTEALEEGAQLCFGAGIYSAKPASVVSYATAGAATAVETVTCTAGTDGTSLGTIPTTAANFDADGPLNIAGRVGYGDNRWAFSAIRQYLNSAAAAGQWWTPQTKWDRPPNYADTTAGHLAGFPEEFVAALTPIKIVTAKPYVDGGTAQGDEAYVTYDKVFLPSMEQLYWTAPSYGVPYGLEGEPWEYWKEAYGQDSPAAMGQTHTEYCLGSYGAETTMRTVFERSAIRSTPGTVAHCYSSGTLSTTAAIYGHFVAPAYCICES